MIEAMIAAAKFALLGALAAGIVAAVAAPLEPYIERGRERDLRTRLADLTGVAAFADTDVPVSDTDGAQICLPGRPSIRILRGEAHGYGGIIQYLVAVTDDGGVLGVRVASHKESPGIGDVIERSRSDWILSLAGRRDDIQAIDGLSGATITTAALVDAVTARLDAHGPRHTLDPANTERNAPCPR